MGGGNKIGEEAKAILVELRTIRPTLEISIIDDKSVDTARKELAQEAIDEELLYGWCKLMVIRRRPSRENTDSSVSCWRPIPMDK